MHHLTYLNADEDCNNENICFYMAKCNDNMTKSYHALLPTFDYIMRLNRLNLLEVKWLILKFL